MSEETIIEQSSFEMVINTLTKVDSYIWVFIIVIIISGLLTYLGQLSSIEFITSIFGSSLIAILFKLLKEKK